MNAKCCQGLDPECAGAETCAKRAWAEVDSLRAELVAARADADRLRDTNVELHRIMRESGHFRGVFPPGERERLQARLDALTDGTAVPVVPPPPTEECTCAKWGCTSGCPYHGAFAPGRPYGPPLPPFPSAVPPEPAPPTDTDNRQGWLATLDDGCTVTLYADTPPIEVGHFVSCRHSPCYQWDPDTGEERKYERDRRVVSVAAAGRSAEVTP